MRLALLALITFAVSLSSQQQKSKTQQPQQIASADQRGTKESPVVVKILPAEKTPDEAAQEKKDRDHKAENDGSLVKLTGVLALVAVFQLIVYAYQAGKLRETVKSAGEQSKAMERHIGEAARSADAMEEVVSVIKAGNQAVMRAYLTVIIGTPIYQMRRVGQSDLRFEGRPHLVNTGNTPARKVRILVTGDILPNPIPDDFTFPLPSNSTQTAGGTVGAHQTLIMAGIVDRFVPDAEVANIKEGVGMVLCVWGLITYDDIFGENHTTKFGQLLTWLPNETVFGYYLTGQNDSD